jgi:hypothetical protein
MTRYGAVLSENHEVEIEFLFLNKFPCFVLSVRRVFKVV